MGNKKKKKLRIAMRKNRQKRARKRDLTRELIEEEDLENVEVETGERVSGKGDLSRYRTVVGVEGAEGVIREVDESKCLAGRVLSAVGLNSTVQTDDGHRYECTVRQVVRMMERDERNPLATGDRVLIRPTDAHHGVIERIEPRHGTVSRGARGKEQILVANVDQMLIVASAVDPTFKPALIDRFLISAEKGGVRSLICINKIDRVDPAELQPVAGVYGRLGYDVVLTSATQPAGIERLRSLLAGRETAVAGQSGVGKSSLLNALQPGLNLKTADVSEESRKGKHTTRRADLLPLDFGGFVVDTPGVRQFGLWDVIPEEVEGFFVEFRPFVTRCRFPDCSHTHERGCGVKRAVVGDLISRERYESYLRIVEGD